MVTQVNVDFLSNLGIGIECATFCPEARAEARKAQQDASRALKAAEEAKAAAEAAKTEKERVDRMFEQTMKK